jgi:hypothetical protein
VSLKNYRILSIEYGQARTAQEWRCVDKFGMPIPWYTYPAIEYIKQIDFQDKRIFEYGSGYSTLFWASRCKHIVSVENDLEWYQRIKKQVPENTDYLFLSNKEDYISAIDKYPGDFDIIIIDGIHRYDCAVVAQKKLKGDGIIILDNSDWHEKTSNFLRKSDLIEIDMSGFGPINGYTWTTSFYLTRQVHLNPAHDRQPVHGVGGLEQTETSEPLSLPKL